MSSNTRSPASSDARLDVVLYTRQGCHLCEQAEQVLADHGISPRLQDIDADAALQERFGMTIPVVEIDSRIRFRGAVSPVLLRRLLHQLGSSGS